jgi:hypothetical protein
MYYESEKRKRSAALHYFCLVAPARPSPDVSYLSQDGQCEAQELYLDLFDDADHQRAWISAELYLAGPDWSTEEARPYAENVYEQRTAWHRMDRDFWCAAAADQLEDD